MKKLFIICCDIMVIAAGVCIGAIAVWVVSALIGAAAVGPAKIVCIVAFITAIIACAVSYAVWLHGGALDDIEEGDK